MTIEIKWTDSDPQSGERRFLRAARFAGRWQFAFRAQRRDVTWRELEPTQAMWEHVLDSLRRRYRRREGVDDKDVRQVELILQAWREPREDTDTPDHHG